MVGLRRGKTTERWGKSGKDVTEGTEDGTEDMKTRDGYQRKEQADKHLMKYSSGSLPSTTPSSIIGDIGIKVQLPKSLSSTTSRTLLICGRYSLPFMILSSCSCSWLNTALYEWLHQWKNPPVILPVQKKGKQCSIGEVKKRVKFQDEQENCFKQTRNVPSTVLVWCRFRWVNNNSYLF